MTTKARATVEDLRNVHDSAKAEIGEGEIVLISPTGGDPGYASDEIFVSLREYSRRNNWAEQSGTTKRFTFDCQIENPSVPMRRFTWVLILEWSFTRALPSSLLR
ncbi:MAG TPA: hypothetical protein VFV34_24945 [Blastocatellia bacterium]|nr:hypothetical protein [Blastocatellia bacterium]